MPDNVHVTAAEVFNVHQINKRAFLLHYIQIKIVE